MTHIPEDNAELAALRARVADLEESLARAEGEARRLEALAETGRKAAAASHRIRNRAAALLAVAELLAARAAGQERLGKLAQAVVEEAESIADAAAAIGADMPPAPK